MPDEDSIPDQILEVPDQHSLANSGNAAVQFARAQGAVGKPPQDRPLPSSVDHGQHGIYRTVGHFLLRYRHLAPCLFTDIFVSMAFCVSIVLLGV
jgi:hypothetical protein